MRAGPGVAFYPSRANVDGALVHRVEVRFDGGVLGEGEVGPVLLGPALVALVRHFWVRVSFNALKYCVVEGETYLWVVLGCVDVREKCV